jgi:ATP-dependent helicase/nuclease subunit A
VRLYPVIIALHEKVKARNRALDQLDLLVKLRDLLVHDPAVRGRLQNLFDHIFVDEFQDTDPLQAEIVLYLCERTPVAEHWAQVSLRPGSLTLVGDPKQSIYRFRRADVAMYDRVRALVAGQDALAVTLSANFRSVPRLITWLNDRFDGILGRSPDEQPFDVRTGRVFQQRLDIGRSGTDAPAVHVLPFGFPDGDSRKVDEYRRLEGQVLARYLRWLVAASDVRIEDPLHGQLRRVHYGDIAVLAVSTWNLPLLFPWLDAEGIPYTSRGGTLFLQDALHRQFLLGLRALADRDDGVAEAALLRPPFFALDLADLVYGRAAQLEGAAAADDGVARVRLAQELIRELRQRRFDRSPGATARELLDRTAFARAVALGPNPVQRLARVRELCLVLEQTAAEEGLDFDAATARLREWVDAPVQLDPPHPTGDAAVQVMTVHQAKGLEFPVVALWDSRLTWDLRLDQSAWRMERDGRGFLMNLKGLGWEEPPGLGLKATEKEYLLAERRRVVYVATTRARDLLVVPKAGQQDRAKYVPSALLDGADPELVRELEPYMAGTEPAWARAIAAPDAPPCADGARLEREIAERWSAAAAEAGRPRFRPVSVTGEAHAIGFDDVDRDAGEVTDASRRKPRNGRYGALFGETVHRAIGLVLNEPGLHTADAVQRAARGSGLEGLFSEAASDVERALEALRSAGFIRAEGRDVQLEYPVAGAWDGGTLLTGYVDLVAVARDRLDVIDFKTDPPPREPIDRAYPQYASQVRLYGRLLAAAGVVGARETRYGLLFTADGTIRWLDEPAVNT